MNISYKYIFIVFFFFLFIVCRSEQSVSQHQGKTHDNRHANHNNEKFNAKELIFDHIKDSYGWHIATYKDHHITIPLPIIIYSNDSGLHIFSSSQFHHGHNTFRNFYIADKGPYAGQIVELRPDGSEIKPLDLSITKNVLSIFVSVFLMFLVFIPIANRYKKYPMEAPKGIQSFFEPVILFVRDDIARPAIGEEKYQRFMPYLLSIFFFIWFNNMMGLIPIFPGGANVTGNISVTMTLAMFTFFTTAINGNKHYWKEIYNAPGIPWWMKVPLPLMPIIEFLGLFTKPFTLTIRLFANISAGHIIALAFFSLIFILGNINPLLGFISSPITVIFTVFMAMLELLVAAIQAFVFTLLSALYFGMAVAEHHGEHEKDH